MTHALLVLAVASGLQVPDTTTYADAATESLVVQARGRHAYHDSLIRDYSARVETRIDVGFGKSRFARVPPVVAHETAAQIRWSLPNNLKVDVVGQHGGATSTRAGCRGVLSLRHRRLAGTGHSRSDRARRQRPRRAQGARAVAHCR
jgi:hypothetical protein